MEYVMPSTPEDERRRARATVEDAARRGETPSETFNPDELAEFFSPDEIINLDAQAEQAREENARRRERREQDRALRRMTERVLEEWDQEEQANRRRNAEAVARKRLGIK
jgi:hypothetical protein